jgi:hypothetical protein
MARTKRKTEKPKADKSKEQLAKDLQKSMLRQSPKASPAENLASNTQFAGEMSTTIGSIIENISVENEVDFSDEQKKIFEDMLKTLKKIAVSQGDTTKDREQLRAMFAKMVVQAEKQAEKIEKDIETTDKQLEGKEEEVRYLKQWQEKAQEDTELSEKEKEDINLDLEAREKELENLRTDKERLAKALDAQKKLGEDAKSKMEEPKTGEKRLTLMDALKGDTSAALKKFAPGLNFEPEEGQSYGDMLKGNLKKVTTGKGFMEAFGSVLQTPGKKLPSNEQLIDAERQALNTQEEIDKVRAGVTPKLDETATTEPVSSDADVLSGAVEDVEEKGMWSLDETGFPVWRKDLDNMASKAKLDTAETTSEGEISPEKQAQDTGEVTADIISPEKQEQDTGEVTADIISPPTKQLEELEQEGKIQSDMLSALNKIVENTQTSANADEERDREEDNDQSTLSNNEIEGQVDSGQSKQSVLSSEEGEGQGGDGSITNRVRDTIKRNKNISRLKNELKNRGGKFLQQAGQKQGGMTGRLMQTAGRSISGTRQAASGVRMASTVARAAPLVSGAGTAAAGLGAAGTAAAGTAAAGTAAAGLGAAGTAAAGLGAAGTAAAGTAAAGTAAAGTAAAGGLAAAATAAAPFVLGALAVGAVGFGAYKLYQHRKKKREERAAKIEEQKSQLQAKQAEISTEASTKTSAAVEEATEKAGDETPVGMSSSTVNNTVMPVAGGGGEAPGMGPTEIRIQDNSFIRFQDKRVARV